MFAFLGIEKGWDVMKIKKAKKIHSVKVDKVLKRSKLKDKKIIWESSLESRWWHKDPTITGWKFLDYIYTMLRRWELEMFLACIRASVSV